MLKFDVPTPTVYINTYDNLHSLGGQMGTTAPSSAAWSTANRAIFVPFRLFKPATAFKMGVFNGTTVSGNIDLGIYDISGNRLASTGSTAHAGTSTLQQVNLTASVKLDAGLFYMAVALDNNVGHLFRRSHNNDICRGMGLAQANSSFPLPAIVTFAAPTGAYVPLIGVKFYNA